MAEQMRASSPVPARIPRYIGNLNALAADAGLIVEMAVEPYGNNPELRLWANWRGARETFLTFVQPVASYRLPLSSGTLNIPGGAGYYRRNAIVSGDVTVTGNDVLFEIDFGPAEFDVSDAAGVEIVSYADETLYHGSADGLIALGIERTRLPLRKRSARSFRDCLAEKEEWYSRRQPDGSIVYRVESPAAFRAHRERVANFYAERHQPVGVKQLAQRPSHLRLVVDNRRE